jgi:hypothetical protein
MVVGNRERKFSGRKFKELISRRKEKEEIVWTRLR